MIVIVQLDHACRKKGKGASLNGAAWPLTIWMWERIPVGRPRKLPPTPWDYDLDGDDEWRLPTVAYTWDRVEAYKDLSMGRYKSYTNELDTLSFNLVCFGNVKFDTFVTSSIGTNDFCFAGHMESVPTG